MRGKPEDMVAEIVGTRITPAYAGKTILVFNVAALLKDHPRVCGENPNSATTSSSLSGSPPRMRGKRMDSMRYGVSKRITPAYAGKTVVLDLRDFLFWDHPRVCGENVTLPAHAGR